MLFVLSPAKSLKFDYNINCNLATIPEFIDDCQILIGQLKKLKTDDLAKLMKLSDKLAELNFQRYQNFNFPFNPANSKQALLVFDGDVYKSIDIRNYNYQDFTFAQRHLRILSGLYGILKPMDLIQAYRLEMGTNFKNSRGKNLYDFWQDKITESINNQLKHHREQVLINLASDEYFKVVKADKIKGQVINIIFKEKKGDKYKVIGLLAKRARGLMANYIVKNRINSSYNVKAFNGGGYEFRSEFSDQNNWHFYR